MKKKILVIPYSRTLSHLSRPLEIAKELRKNNYELIFATDKDSNKNKFIIEEDFNRIDLFEPDADILFNNIRKGKIKFAAHDLIEYMIKKECELFQEIKPDLILTDGRFTAPISAQICNIKHSAIVNASSTAYRSIPYMPIISDTAFKKINRFNPRFSSLICSANLFFEKKIFDNLMHSFITFSNQFKISKKVTATNCLTGADMTLLADIPEYFPTKNLPDNYHYIGPITWKTKKKKTPDWWPVKPHINQKVIYVTMGTTGDIDFFPIVYDLLKTSNMISIITTGAQIENFESNCNNIHIESYLDGEEIINVSDVTVCHGGNGTIYQSLNQGKPIIGIPTLPDQEFNMRRVEELGVGKKISIDAFFKNPKILLDTIHSIISNPVFYKNANILKKRLKTYSPAKKASDLIKKSFES